MLFETEEQLTTLEELVKDVDLERKMNEYRTQTSYLREQKFLEFEKLKGILIRSDYSLSLSQLFIYF